MIEDFINQLKKYAKAAPHIESVIVVGSYARGTNREDSDIDIVVITSDKAGMIARQDFTKKFGKICRQQTEYYGACTSVRAWYEDGKEVEFGIVEPSWISAPLDDGTIKVLSGGYKIIIDKKQHFKGLEV